MDPRFSRGRWATIVTGDLGSVGAPLVDIRKVPLRPWLPL